MFYSEILSATSRITEETVLLADTLTSDVWTATTLIASLMTDSYNINLNPESPYRVIFNGEDFQNLGESYGVGGLKLYLSLIKDANQGEFNYSFKAIEDALKALKWVISQPTFDDHYASEMGYKKRSHY